MRALLLRLAAWLRGLLRRLRRSRIRRQRRRLLPFDLFLTTGGHSMKLFAAGPLDEFFFFERHHVSERHELEYLTCAGPAHRDREDYQAYALLKLRPGEALPLPDLSEVEAALVRHYGHALVRLPDARPLLVERRYGSHRAFYNRILEPSPVEEGEEPEEAPAEAGPSARFSTAEMLDIMRKELTTPQRIAWIEAAFRDPLTQGDIVHRYYLDPGGRVFLIRHHWRDGRRLFQAVASREALQVFPACAITHRPDDA